MIKLSNELLYLYIFLNIFKFNVELKLNVILQISDLLIIYINMDQT